MTLPLVSVIVPAYNHRRYIEDALASVVSQDYRPLELIVIDDGSSDGTFEVAEAFLRSEMPSAIVLRQRNAGAHSAINAGLRLASGRFLTILNSDDAFRPGRLRVCVETALLYGCELLFTSVNYIDDEGGTISSGSYVDALRRAEADSERDITLGYSLLRNQLAITTGNFFISRWLHDAVGPFRPYRYVHDWDFLLRSLFFAEPYFLRLPYYDYRLHDNNSFSTLGDVADYETTEIMRNYFWSVTARHPSNHRAPSPQYWPYIFEEFVRRWNYHIYLPPRMRIPVPKGARLCIGV